MEFKIKDLLLEVNRAVDKGDISLPKAIEIESAAEAADNNKDGRVDDAEWGFYKIEYVGLPAFDSGRRIARFGAIENYIKDLLGSEINKK